MPKATATITNTTKTYVTFQVTTKINTQVKVTVKDWSTVNKVLSFLDDKKEIKKVIDGCKAVLQVKDYQQLKSHFFPTVKETKKAAKSCEARKNYFALNEQKMDAEINKMANQPDFLGGGVTRSELNSTVCKEVQKLYGVHGGES